MSGGWPATIDPIQLAEQGATLSGEFPLARLPRLAGMCAGSHGAVRIDLTFERTEGDGLRVMHGTVRAPLSVVCQRCLEPMTLELVAQPYLILVGPEERRDLVEAGDALAVERPVPLADLIEDELLLVLPMVPMHPLEQCPARAAVGRNGKTEKQPERPNPFAALGRLKRDQP